MRYFLDTNVLIFYAQGGESLDKDTTSIFGDYENLIYVSSEVIKEIMHLIRHKKIGVKDWKNPNDIWKSIKEWGVPHPADHIIIAQAITNKIPLISSDQQFRHYKKQGLSLVFNNTRGK